MKLNRRAFLTGLAAFAAPAIIPYSSLVPAKNPCREVLDEYLAGVARQKYIYGDAALGLVNVPSEF